MPGRILAENLNRIRKEYGWSQEVTAEKCNLPYETIKNICAGRTLDPKASTLQAISDGTGYPMDCLMGNCKHTLDERDILKDYRSCDSHGKDMIRMVAKYEADAIKNCVRIKDVDKTPCLILDEPINEQGKIIPRYKV